MLVGLAVLALAFFVLPTRVHERYLFPLAAIGAILAAVSLRWRIAYVLSAAATFANMYVVLTTYYHDNPRISDWLGTGDLFASPWGVAIASITQAVVLGWAFFQLRDEGGRGHRGGGRACRSPARGAESPGRLARSTAAGRGPRCRHRSGRARRGDRRCARRRPSGLVAGSASDQRRCLRRRAGGRHARVGRGARRRLARTAGVVARAPGRHARPRRQDAAARGRARRAPGSARRLDAGGARDQPADGPHVAARRAVPDALRRGLPPADGDRVPPGLALRPEP